MPLTTQSLLDTTKTVASSLFSPRIEPWRVLPDIGKFILSIGATLAEDEYEQIFPHVWAAKDATLYESAFVAGPCIIDHEAEIRHCAFIRGNAIIGKGSVVGNSTELKNAILFDNAQAPHYNYVGDSILGFKAHMGAGAITSNVRADKANVRVTYGHETIETGLRKFGAIVGDYGEIGCGAVLNPGTVIGRGSRVYPLSSVRCVVPERSIHKTDGQVVLILKR